MGAVLIVNRLKTSDGLVENYVQNSWVFNDPAEPDPAEVGLAASAKLQTFYTSIGGYIGTTIGTTGARLWDAYDLAAELETPGAGTGSPVSGGVADMPIKMSSPSPSMPSEVAVVLSFHGDLTGALVEVGNTRPRARRHGRVFLGPLNKNAVEEGLLSVVRPAVAFRTAVIDAAEVLAESAGPVWSVWSRTDGVIREVRGGWVDDAFDTQRRRGVAPTLRGTFIKAP